ncbi:hypothetical protein FOC1_g10007800 [Fusarium oxysporum f. sp. cubense race 1]|uniref:DUF1593-domain-containing protein n=1 Tax=Fusarium oxysporum f. sp. cubense (strain race 1) TaxID=1229664 RepID=N4UJQ0_FUSC1|nr:hypothetical protein FOC1_g10007800 [Fusarium oxysporum f. sp. cubense race 1]
MALFFTHLLSVVLWLQSCFVLAVPQQHGSADLSTLPKVSRVRTFILTDILNEPDDSMSMVRYLLYSNEFDTRGLVAVTSWSLRNDTHPSEIKKIIKAYAKVVDKLNQHVHPDNQYPKPEELLKQISSGPRSYGRAALKEPISDGAKLLVKRLQESKEPLHVSLWGGANTLAQALQHIEKTKSREEAVDLRSRLRVYSISDQDDTGAYIRVKWPDVFFIVNVHGYREYRLGTWTEYGGWGGRYTRVTEDTDINEYGTSGDALINTKGQSWFSPYATIWRWRDAYQDDFAARMQWTLVDSFEEGAHPPSINVNGSMGSEPLRFKVGLRDAIFLDASNTIDTDSQDDSSGLDFEWYSYAECASPMLTSLAANFFSVDALSPPAGTNGTLAVNEAGFSNVVLGPKVRISTNLTSWEEEQPSSVDKEWHVILQVTNNKGSYPIRRYRRVILELPDSK